jgi:predicted nucleic acid-binding protein
LTQVFLTSARIRSISLVSAAMPAAIADTGPLVAFLDRRERHHGWVTARIRELDAPLLVCEPVLAEAMYLLARFPPAQDALFGLLENGALNIAFRAGEHVPALRRLVRKYRDRPMSLADACIVRMAEVFERHSVFTLDSDFSVYRKHSGVPLSVIHPGGT